MQIQGTVKDNAGTLPAANVYFTDPDGKYNPANAGTITNSAGNYTLVGEGTHVTASYTGYSPQTKPAAALVNFNLSETSYNLPEIVITAKMIWPRVLAALVIIAAAWFIYKKLKK